jgi:hypothetical protein
MSAMFRLVLRLENAVICRPLETLPFAPDATTTGSCYRLNHHRGMMYFRSTKPQRPFRDCHPLSGISHSHCSVVTIVLCSPSSRQSQTQSNLQLSCDAFNSDSVHSVEFQPCTAGPSSCVRSTTLQLPKRYTSSEGDATNILFACHVSHINFDVSHNPGPFHGI